MIDLVALQAGLDGWPADHAKHLGSVPKRLLSAMNQAASSDCGPGDLAALVRDVLREWQEGRSVEVLPAPLRVPAGDPWPDPETWRHHGVAVAPGIRPDELRITGVRPWCPTWLEGTDAVDAFPACREPRWPSHAVLADPVWRHATGFKTYRSFEQREAVRTVLASGEDAIVLVVLATGSGKSLVGLLDPLTYAEGRTAIVVIPTTSLAIDQEEQLRAGLAAQGAPDAENRFAWFSGMPDTAARDMLTRIREGRQRVVFASPESLFRSLGDALTEAARHGRLGQFVVDEAHMVAAWGADFRPDFQALAGFRHRLRAAASEGGHRFRTLLMTATVTQSDVETLHNLFVDAGRRMIVAGAPALRPEISYLTSEAPSREVRLERVCEAVRNLPRPLFLYATTKPDVAGLLRALHDLGCSRVVSVTGDSTDGERRDAVQALRGTPESGPIADIAVGTSAFGLGIDIPDVRVVVHACLPEGIDRYYQEVGRAARDGRAALGLLLWTDSDVDTAASLSRPRQIGQEFGQERWRAMARVSEREGDVTWLPLTALRIGLDEHSEENERWNSRLLSSMVSAGFIELAGTRRAEDGEPAIAVRVRRQDLGASSAWNDFEAMRARSRQRSDERLGRMRGLAATGAVCETLMELFSVHDPARLTADLVTHHACGGCVACSPPRPVPVAPLPVDRTPAMDDLPAPLLWQLSHGGMTAVVADDDSGWPDAVAQLIGAACHAGIRQIVCEPATSRMPEVGRVLDELVEEMGLRAPLLTLVADPPNGVDDLEFLPHTPCVLLLDPARPRTDAQAIVRALPRPCIAVFSKRQPSDVRPDMTIRELRPATLDVAQITDRLLACQI